MRKVPVCVCVCVCAITHFRGQGGKVLTKKDVEIDLDESVAHAFDGRDFPTFRIKDWLLDLHLFLFFVS